ncbi:MAG TPA: NAD-dependent epimerase/dehydratase family protein [Bdellovibrionales bacterium]|nr:NAD-dependent epimerase/dehydratase family protein [Bdellovibrionales bacterium]
MRKVLIIGGNRFVGLRLSLLLDTRKDIDLHVVNRTGQVAHAKNATIHKGDRSHLDATILDRDWDIVFDFAVYKGAEARHALEYFKNVGRYIYISTVSVYDPGHLLDETKFHPLTWDYHETIRPGEEPYQFGKRQVEAVFSKECPWPHLAVRLPLILGPDDYTGRLSFHIDRIKNGQPIFIPNMDSRISVIHAGDAANFLLYSLDHAHTGPLNVASPDPVRLGDLIALIERKTLKSAIRLKQLIPGTESPYGGKTDFSVSTAKMGGLGFMIRPASVWLPELVESLALEGTREIH